MTPVWWAESTTGEIVWCHFPENINPRPKPRPALILAVFDDDAPQFHIKVVYGSSQRTTTLRSGEFSILRERNPAADETAGLSYDTKFDLQQATMADKNEHAAADPGARAVRLRLAALRRSKLATARKVDAIVRQLRGDGVVTAILPKYGIGFLPPDAAAK